MKSCKHKVVFLPALQDLNPYQRLLQNSLHKHGWKVRYVTGSTGELIRLAFASDNLPQTVHVHWPEPYILADDNIKVSLKCLATLAAFSVLRVRGVNLVYTLHNLENHERRYARTERLFLHIFLRLVQSIFIHCECAGKLLENRYGQYLTNKTRIIPHGHYLDAYPVQPKKSIARTELGFAEHERVFLFAGTLRPYKGVEQLVEEFCRIKRPHDRLIIAGRVLGDFSGMLKTIAETEQIQLIEGFVSDADLVNLLSAGDVFVAPFTDVLTSGSVILAMSFSLPCIAPKIGCLPETLSAQEQFIYDASEPRAGLSSALSLAQGMSNAELERLGRNNKKRVLTDYSWSIVGAVTASEYEKFTTSED